MKYTIKNFRVFDKDGVTLDMRPMTILTGCNSSGKSSIVKSMVLLDSFFNSLRKDADFVITDHIKVYYNGTEKIDKMLESWKDYVWTANS